MTCKPVSTDGNNEDFIILCKELDQFLNQLVGGQDNRAEYIPYNQLDDIYDVVLAYDKQIPIGCASFKKYTREKNQENHIAEVKRVFVKEQYRGFGIAKELMNNLETQAVKQGYKKLILESGEPLVAAMGLYRSLGYQVTANYEPYVNMSKSICMEKIIGCYYYKKATIDDLEILVSSRIEVLRAANKLTEDTNMSEVEISSRTYYINSLANDTHIAYLVYDGDKVIGTGGISFYQVMPTYHNASGKKAYVMNMYTHPDYRRKRIAFKMLDLLVKEAKERGIKQISLEATEAGKPLYKKYGFTQMENEWEFQSV